MGSPEDIPDDIWNVAFHHMDDYSLISAFYTDEDEQKVRTCVSRAILAERERCASIADACAKEYGPKDKNDSAGWSREIFAKLIKMTILTGEQP